MSNIRKKPYLDFKTYLTGRYGESLYRVPIDLDFGCPNRNPDGSGGCTFCSLNGSRATQTLSHETIHQQIAAAMDFAKQRYDAREFIAYFQAYTSTFAPLSQQRYIYESVLEAYQFKAVSIGTRPDCLSPAVIRYLSELNQSIDVWIELGIQTVHDQTLRRINRGHDWAVSEKAIHQLHDAGINIAAHVILGLPGETPAHYMQTANMLAGLPIDATKLHNLHIIENTGMAEEYRKGLIKTLHPFEYGEYVIDFIRRTPADRPFMRMTTDTVPDELIAPKWQIDKGQFLHWLHTQMAERGVTQGDLLDQPIDSRGAGLQEYAKNLLVGVQHSIESEEMEEIAFQSMPWDLLDYRSRKILRFTEQHMGYQFNVRLGDPRFTIKFLPYGQYEHILMNTHAASQDAICLTDEFLELVLQRLSPKGQVIFTSRDWPVMACLLRNEFNLYETQIGSRYGFIASKRDLSGFRPIDAQQKGHISRSAKSRPFHDPDLCWPHTKILRHRELQLSEVKAMAEAGKTV